MRYKLRHDDPVFYKRELTRLLAEAKDNDVDVFLGVDADGTRIYFRVGDTGECAAVKIPVRDTKNLA